jgi:hypothetical protein
VTGLARATRPGRKLDRDLTACYRDGMLRVALKLCLAAAALAAIWAFVPVGGRTMSERWRRAGNAGAFADGIWAEIRPGTASHESADRHAQARNGAAAKQPAESYSPADREALDRTLSRHLTGN